MNYADFEKKTQAATEQFHVLSAQIKSAEARMAEIAVLMDALPAPNGADFGVWGALPSTSILRKCLCCCIACRFLCAPIFVLARVSIFMEKPAFLAIVSSVWYALHTETHSGR